MNRWYVYEYLKRIYLDTGRVPTMTEILEEFQGLDYEEVIEGIEEFKCVTGVSPSDIREAV